MARGFAAGGEIPPLYFRLGRIWIAVGLVATIPLTVALWVMVRKGW